MGNRALINPQILTDIADSIRGKTGKTEPIKVSQMASEIGGIDTDLSNLSDLVGADVGDGKSDIENAVTGLINSANATTGNTDTNLTDGVNALIGGYGQGGSSGGVAFDYITTDIGNATLFNIEICEPMVILEVSTDETGV